jgi:hypothetical protein
MGKNLGILVGLGLLLMVPAAMGQSASGNVSVAGPYAAWELYDAQNPPAMTYDGCVINDHHDYWLMPKKGKPMLLNFVEGQHVAALVGARVKVRGRENIGAARRRSSPDGLAFGVEGRHGRTETIIENEINVHRVKVVSESCPADWYQGKKRPE